jgi:uncharacterized membrane protein
MDYYMIVLRFVHVISFVIWAGWIFSLRLWIQPAVEAAGPAGGAFMGAITSKTKLITTVAWAGTLTIISGLLMMDHVSGHFDMGWVQSPQGTILIIGGLSAIIGFSFGMARVRPAAMRVGALSAQIQQSGGQPTPEQGAELQNLRATIKKGGNIVFQFLVVTTVCMAVARYIH